MASRLKKLKTLELRLDARVELFDNPIIRFSELKRLRIRPSPISHL